MCRAQHARRGDDARRRRRESLERIGRISTVAVARWMAGGDPRTGCETGREAWELFGQLAAHRARRR